MAKSQRRRVQEEPLVRQSLVGSVAVAKVVHYRVTNGRQVHSNLVGATSVEMQSQQRHRVRFFHAGDHFVAGPRGTSVRTYGHQGRSTRRTTNRRVDDAALFDHVTLDHAEVRSFHYALGELTT